MVLQKEEGLSGKSVGIRKNINYELLYSCAKIQFLLESVPCGGRTE